MLLTHRVPLAEAVECLAVLTLAGVGESSANEHEPGLPPAARLAMGATDCRLTIAAGAASTVSPIRSRPPAER